MRRNFTLPLEYTPPCEEITQPAKVEETLRENGTVSCREQSDPAPEFGVSSDAPASLGAAGQNAGDTGSRDAHEKTATRREKRKRSLLLQAAAVASAVVLVTDSFGMDFLKLDGFFNESVILGEFFEHPYEDFPEEETRPAPHHHSEEPFKETVHFMRLGGSTEEPQINSSRPVVNIYEDGSFYGPMITAYDLDPYTGETIGETDCIYIHPRLEAMRPVTEREGIYYDETENTLILDNVDDPILCLNIFMMGSDFRILVEGENIIGRIITNGQMTNGSVRISGSGVLVVNPEMQFDTAIDINALHTDSVLIIEDTVTLALFAQESVVQVRETTHARGIILLSEEVTGFFECYQETGKGDGTAVIRDPMEEEPLKEFILEAASRNTDDPGAFIPSDLVAVGGDRSFPVLPNQNPNNYVEGFGFLNEDYIFICESMSSNGAAQSGGGWYAHLNQLGPYSTYGTVRSDAAVYYNEDTNTLYLHDFQGAYIECNMMGNGLKIQLEGTNILSGGIRVWGFNSGGSVTFTGTGSLGIGGDWDGADGMSAGIILMAEGSESCIMVEEGVTMSIHGRDSAIIASQTTAVKPVYILSDSPVPYIYQQQIDYTSEYRKQGNLAEYYNDLFPIWLLWDGDENGEPVTELEIVPR